LDEAIAERTSSRLRLAAASALEFTCTRTAGRWPPESVTRPTPATCESFCARRVSARFWISGSVSVRDERPSVRTGASAGFTLLYTGGAGRSAGSRFEPALIAACTPCSATSSGMTRSNCSVTTEAPPELVDDICFNPGIWPSWRSSGAVTDEAITSGLAPG
jgi:hypothetical protein